MILADLDWSSFYTYLVTEVKISQKSGNINSVKSRFAIFCRTFPQKEITREAFNEYLVSLQEKSIANSTLNKYITLIKQIAKWQKVGEFDDYTYYKEHRQYYDVLTTDEVKRIAEVEIPYARNRIYVNQRNRTLTYLLYGIGCRIDEALTLTWTNIHKTPFGYAVFFPETKNGESRDVLLQPFVAELLLALPKLSDLVFNMKNAQEFNRDLKRRAKEGGVNKVVWCHLFRHSWASHMLVDKEVDGHIVALIGGWSDPKSLQHYNQMNLKAQAKFMMMHDLGSEKQKLDDIHQVTDGFLGKLLNKNLWSAVFERKNDELHIKVKKRLLPTL